MRGRESGEGNCCFFSGKGKK
jgi:hypothetical protein